MMAPKYLNKKEAEKKALLTTNPVFKRTLTLYARELELSMKQSRHMTKE